MSAPRPQPPPSSLPAAPVRRDPGHDSAAGGGLYRLLSSDSARFQFTGSAWEYFRIWFANVVLTVLSLGIYSAWASVRSRQYFASHTMLAGRPFACHAQPLRLLAMRVAVSLILLAIVLPWWFFGAGVAALGLAAAAAAAPWALRLHWRSSRESMAYDGVRFSFRASVYDTALLLVCCPPLLLFLPFSPLGLFLAHRLLVNNTHYDKEAFRFHGTIAHYYEPFAVVIFSCIGLLLIGYALYLSLAGALLNIPGSWVPIILCALLVSALWATAYVLTSTRNLLFSSIWLSDQHRFVSDQRSLSMMWVLATGWLATLLSLGLMWPWSRVRLARYRAEHLVVLPHSARDAAIAAYRSE